MPNISTHARTRTRTHAQALLWAAFNGHQDTVKALLAAGASLTERNRINSDAFICACAGGSISLVRTGLV